MLQFAPQLVSVEQGRTSQGANTEDGVRELDGPATDWHAELQRNLASDEDAFLTAMTPRSTPAASAQEGRWRICCKR
jgi:hypothetical protein